MHQKELKIEIISPAGPIFEGDCFQATIPSEKGEMGILADHEATISKLAEGVVKILDKKDQVLEEYPIKGGFAEMFNNRLLILID
ncbi:MAG: F-type H+-transporting ATPase subunit epsilon [Lentimonas sp.]|jgi:F-type H+-transporting ATPase subunit epsilon